MKDGLLPGIIAWIAIGYGVYNIFGGNVLVVMVVVIGGVIFVLSAYDKAKKKAEEQKRLATPCKHRGPWCLLRYEQMPSMLSR